MVRHFHVRHFQRPLAYVHLNNKHNDDDDDDDIKVTTAHVPVP